MVDAKNVSGLADLGIVFLLFLIAPIGYFIIGFSADRYSKPA